VRSGFGPPPQSVKFPTVSRDKIIDCGVPLATITAKKCDIGAYQHGDEKPWRPGHNFDNAPDPKYEPPTTPLRNLIINSGFDYASIYAKLGEGKENPAPWKLLGNAKIEHHKGFNSPPADGRNSILAHSATLAATGDGVEQTFSGLVAETKYHCSGYVRHEADTDVAFTILDTSGETIASASSRADGRLGGGWRFVQFSFHTGENQETATLRIVNQGTGTAYLDETGVMQERGFGSP